MYDDEEEIKRKRRNLLILIGVVVGLIILLLIIIIAKSTHKTSKPKIDPDLHISCELEVLNGIKPNSQNIYTQEIEIGFKSLVAISPDYPIEKKKIGTTDNSRNSETYKITKSGTYKLHGYIQDSAGNKNTCDLSVTVSLSKPSCALEVKEGTLGTNNWYTTDVVVGFKTISSNSETATITKYYIEKEKVDINNQTQIKPNEPAENVETYKVTENQTTNLIGYVIDSNGTESYCTLTVKKDSTIPTCSLKVTSGTADSSGTYKDAPIIGFDNVNDDVSGIANKGIGVKENYTDETYKAEGNDTIKVYGYVKDNAGNNGTCSISVKRPSKPTYNSTPSCNLKTQTSSNGDVTVTIYPSTNGGAKVVSYGVGTAKGSMNGSSMKVTTTGNHTIYGTVNDSYGHTGYCTTTFTVKKGTALATKVKVGDYVSYDAGNWNESPTNMKNNAEVGGFTNGSSRNYGVKCAPNKDTGTRNGWIVLSVSGGKVTLVHAGTPECIYYGSGSSAISEVITKMNSRSQGYINATYAESARALKCGDNGLTCNDSTYAKTIGNTTIYKTGSHYFLASNNGSSLWFIDNVGVLRRGSRWAYGIRPVVVLKSTVKVTGGNGTASDPYKIGL